MSDNRTTELLREFAENAIYCNQFGSLYADEERIAEYAERIEQAIAATLGNGTLTAEQVREAIEANSWAETSTIREFNDSSWQAIADELNAELGGGNCVRCAEDMGRYADSLCDPLKERIAELLRCLENDWHIHASWDGLRKFWCIELTEEGVRVRDAELGSEFVECGICKFYHADIQLCEYGIPPCSKFERNELNARAERTCHNTHENRWFKCSACGYGFTDLYAEDEGDINEQPRYCPNCGAKVVVA